MRIYKILHQAEWDTLCAAGQTAGAPVDQADGFIHFSTATQLAETAAKHFAGVEGLILAAFDADKLGPALTWEPSRGGALFPHLYGPLRRADVIWHHPLALAQGQHVFPEDL
jgi:uncharacterized protein (DUF952 family)